MARQGTTNTPPDSERMGKKSRGRRWLWLIMAAAVGARAWLLFGTHYLPGVNGGYYLVQARALLERGGLGFPDLPLIFHLHAALAWGLAEVSGLAQAEAIVWTVKLCDALLPPLAAWPVFVLVRRWTTARGQGEGVPLAAATLTCFAWPWFRMVGDLQKNSLALVWLAALAVALHGWLGAPTPRRALAVLLCLLLLSLTHIGVLGAALVLLAVVIGVFILRQEPRRRSQILPWLAVVALLLAAAGAWVLWRFDPTRIHRLITAFTNPAKFSADGRPMPAPPVEAGDLLGWLPFLGFAVLVVPGLVLGWRRRRELPAVDFALVVGCSVTVLAMTGPWFGRDKAVRFYLICLLPAIVVGAFSVLHLTSAWWRRGVLGLALLSAVGSTWPLLRAGGRAILSDAAMVELQGLAPLISRPERTLICAQHGVEWWTAWLLHTRITQAAALNPDDWQRYAAVYALEIKSGLAMPYLPGPPPGMGPPAPDRGAVWPPPRPREEAMRLGPIPPPAEILHEGPCLRFARVDKPPAR